MDAGFWGFVFTAAAFFALGFCAKGWLDDAKADLAAEYSRVKSPEDAAREVH